MEPDPSADDAIYRKGEDPTPESYEELFATEIEAGQPFSCHFRNLPPGRAPLPRDTRDLGVAVHARPASLSQSHRRSSGGSPRARSMVEFVEQVTVVPAEQQRLPPVSAAITPQTSSNTLQSSHLLGFNLLGSSEQQWLSALIPDLARTHSAASGYGCGAHTQLRDLIGRLLERNSDSQDPGTASTDGLPWSFLLSLD